jgi:hypothetical protein
MDNLNRPLAKRALGDESAFTIPQGAHTDSVVNQAALVGKYAVR